MLVAFALSARHLWQGAALRRALIPNVMKVFSPDPAFLKRVAVASSSSLPTRVTFGCHHVRPHRSSAYMLGSRELGHWASCELDLLCVLLILHKQYPLTRSARGIRADSMVAASKHSFVSYMRAPNAPYAPGGEGKERVQSMVRKQS